MLPIHSNILPGHNQETYQQLQVAVQETPPYQLLIATCDDLPLQRRLAATLEESVQGQDAIAPTQLIFRVGPADILQQIQTWTQNRAGQQSGLLQILGIEQLTYQGSDAQYHFLRSLHGLLPLWQTLNYTLLIWVPRPWLKQIRREVPLLCQTVFEFIGEPTPISSITGEQFYQAAFSPIRQWQFLGKPAPESPPAPPTERVERLGIAPGATAVPAVPGNIPVTPQNECPPPDIPAFTEDLWVQLQADLTEFESTQPASLPTATPDRAVPETRSPAARPPGANDDTLAQAIEALETESMLSFPSELWDAEVLTASPGVAPLSAAPEQVPDPGLDEAIAQGNSWAIAYELRDRIQAGDSSPATLEAAIQQYEQLLQNLMDQAHRTEVLNDLGSLYWLWAQQSQSIETYLQRLTHSSQLYEASLAPLSAQVEAGILARVHTNLGSVYSLLAGYQDSAQYLGKAVRAFHRALQYTPVETAPAEYATLQTHLGTAYWSLAQHTQEAAHLERAIAAYREALRHAHPQQAALPYAQLQNNLGIALWSLSRYGSPISLLEQAIGAYRTALAYRTLDTDPAGCAATHNNLGTAYWDLGGHFPERSSEQMKAWKQSVTAYETALLAVEHTPTGQLGFDLWATHHSVGVVYDQLAIILAPHVSIQQPLLLRATRHYVEALVGWHTIQATTAEVALQALIRNLQLQSRYLGLEIQQRSLNQIPAAWLPEIWRQL